GPGAGHHEQVAYTDAAPPRRVAPSFDARDRQGCLVRRQRRELLGSERKRSSHPAFDDEAVLRGHGRLEDAGVCRAPVHRPPLRVAPATSGNSRTRSTRWLTLFTAGRETKRGHTTHNLASSTGIDAMPAATCTPWVTRYRPAGRDGTGSHDSGCWWRCE